MAVVMAIASARERHPSDRSSPPSLARGRGMAATSAWPLKRRKKMVCEPKPPAPWMSREAAEAFAGKGDRQIKQLSVIVRLTDGNWACCEFTSDKPWGPSHPD